MSNNLPVEVKSGFLNITEDGKEKIKRTAKAIGYAGIVVASGGVILFSGAVAGLLAMPPLVAGIMGFAKNTVIKISKDSLFGIRKGRNEYNLEQSSLGMDQIKLRRRIKELFKGEESPVKRRYEIGGLMALQTLLVLQKEKMELEKNPKVKNEEGVYSQKYQTVTHGINIENIKLLEELGYLKVEKETFKKQSYLILERLGFGQSKEVGEVLKAVATFNKDKKKSLKKDFHTLDLKVTDKPINIEEMYQMYKDNPKKMKRFNAIFGKKGILANKSIDIQTDSRGMPQIVYDAKKPFIQRIEEEQTRREQEDFRERIDVRDNLSYQMQAQKAEEYRKQQEKATQDLQELNNENNEKEIDGK